MTVDLTSPRAAEVSIDDDAHVVEVLIDMAIRTLLVDCRNTEGRNVRLAVDDTSWDRPAWKEPSLVEIGCPLCDVHTTTIVVEALSIVVLYLRVVQQRAAARVAVCIRIAIGRFEVRSLSTAGDLTTGSRVQRDGVGESSVDALDDI